MNAKSIKKEKKNIMHVKNRSDTCLILSEKHAAFNSKLLIVFKIHILATIELNTTKSFLRFLDTTSAEKAR